MMIKQNTALRDELEKLSTGQLDEMLNAELRKKTPDGDLVRLILKVLKEREKDVHMEITPQVQAAWEEYQRLCAQDEKRFAAQRTAKRRQWVTRFVVAAAVLALLVFAVPPAMGAGNAFELIGRWAEDVIAFFAPTEPEDTQMGYVFQTDNPGLQQVYDEVVKLGITDTVVPMWVPMGYELVELKITNTPTKIKVKAVLSNGSNKIHFTIDIYGTDAVPLYETDNVNSTNIELAGIDHEITSNDGKWVAVWEKDNWQCSLTVDGQEDIIYDVLESIYMTEE